MLVLILAILIGLIPAAIASSKGHNFFLWWLFGAAIWIVALPCALFLKPDRKTLDAQVLATGDSKKCPHCAELIRREANVCRFCGRDVPAATTAANPYLGSPSYFDPNRPKTGDLGQSPP